MITSLRLIDFKNFADKTLRVDPSTGSVGDCYDNAMCESFFATLECELFERRRFRSHAEARMAVFEFIEGWYNPRRRHSAIEYLSPVNYERSQLPPARPNYRRTHRRTARRLRGRPRPSHRARLFWRKLQTIHALDRE